MTAEHIWLAIFGVMYGAFCLGRARRAAAASTTVSGYFLAGRDVSAWMLIPAVTAATFAGLALIHHPALIYAHGLPYATASLGAVAVALAGVLLFKRQWMIATRFGYVTPGEMLASYFGTDAIRVLTVIVAVCFALPLLALQLRAAGLLLNLVTADRLILDAGMWLAAALLLAYVAWGGLRAVFAVGTLQFALFVFVLALLGIAALAHIGLGQLGQGIAALAEMDVDRTPDGYSRYVAVPGVVQLVGDAGAALGGPWTGLMCLSLMLALTGIASSPAFSMLAFASRGAAPFAAHHVWACALLMGGLLLGLAPVIGIGGHLLGADSGLAARYPDLADDLLAHRLRTVFGVADIAQVPGGPQALVPLLIAAMADPAPWVASLLSVCALAALQATGAVLTSTTGAMLARDLIPGTSRPGSADATQILRGRIGAGAVVLAALALATAAPGALLALASVALAAGAQMVPALIALCYAPWFTGAGIVAGLIAGLAAVSVTDVAGPAWLGLEAWGRWPLTLHSAFWGLAANLAVASLVSAATRRRDGGAGRRRVHDFLREHAALPRDKRALVPLAWMLTLVWAFFAAGPGLVIGNTLFGHPDDAGTWLLGVPSLWAWQILWWVLGVGLTWFLAYRMRLATTPRHAVTPLAEAGARET